MISCGQGAAKNLALWERLHETASAFKEQQPDLSEDDTAARTGLRVTLVRGAAARNIRDVPKSRAKQVPNDHSRRGA